MSIKEGYARKWSENKKQWINVYCKLLPSGWFQWFDNQSSTSPKRSVDVRNVTAFLAFGDVLHRVPCKPASITPAEIPQAFGVPHEPHTGTKISFFVCSSPAEMNSWLGAIMSLTQGANCQPAGPPPAQFNPGYSAPPAPPVGMPGQIGFGVKMRFPFTLYLDMPPPYGASQPPVYGYPAGGYAPPQAAPMASGVPSYTVPPSSSYPRQPPPPQGQAGYYTQPTSGQQFVASNGQPYQIVYVEGKPKKKKLGMLKSAAAADLLSDLVYDGLARPNGPLSFAAVAGWYGS
ncbi:hypothetical protein P879_06730 [Paragonimus westermani]|uniref:PH domain-containing protein n=1 Tax=Paragonimus westermani TaxID=34504 RepID=A0A8T0DDT6_9TREM|nr:hypothetical protein P879_06730 [Paragonimus westermani]